MHSGRSRRDFIMEASIAVPFSGLIARSASAGALNYVTAETTLGKIRGTDEDGIKTFKGIPYGANTSGANRFMPPKPVPKWAGVKDALQYGWSAPQNEPGKPVPTSDVAVAGAGMMPENEDCLVINLWTPGLNDGRKRPVMFWCHGGGFASGSGSSPITAGHNLAKRGDVVVITVNHRLNCLGFSNLAALGPDFANSSAVGMMDLVIALNWVKDNAAQFGGDAGNVTIFGQSGGGSKVSTLLAIPSAKGLFHRAIVESGPSLKAVTPEAGEKAATLLLAKLGLSKANAKNIQTVPINMLMSAYFAAMRDPSKDGRAFSPNIANKILPDHPFFPNASPVSASVPLMIGNTMTEWTTFDDRTNPEYFSLDEKSMHAEVEKLLGADADKVIAVYKKANPGMSPPDIFFRIQSDQRMGAPTLKEAERRAALKQGPVYLYYFTWLSPMKGGKYRAPHTVEIPFAWDTIKTANLTNTSPVAQTLADKVCASWIAFARTGNPTVPSLPHWPAMDAENWQTMVFNDESKVVNDPISAQRKVLFEVMKL
jgi:para-nitrobenzyl esterase